MTNRAFWVFAGVLSIIITTQIAVFVRLRGDAASGTVRCRVVNAGLPLSPADARVVMYRADNRDAPIADGNAGAGIQVPPGRYDVQVLYTKSRDRQEAWLEDVVVEKGEQLDKEVSFSAGQLAVAITAGGQEPTAVVGLIQVLAPGESSQVIASFLSGEIAVLRAGSYDLRIALLKDAQEKSVQWLRGVTVTAGLLVTPTVAFNQGQLLVSAANAGKSLPVGAVALSVYRAGDAQEELVERGSSGLPIALAAGRYDVKATLSESSDAATRWVRDVEVAEGRTIDRTIDFSAGTARVKASLAGGHELDAFRVYIYFYKAGDHQQPVAYVPAGEPVVLSAARYDVRAHFFRSHDQPDIWKRGIEIRAGATLEDNVLFPSGMLLIRAFTQDSAELIGDNVFLFVYRASETRTPIARARTGEELTLTEGTYDVRAVDSRLPAEERWLKSLTVESGKTRRAAVTFSDRRP